MLKQLNCQLILRLKIQNIINNYKYIYLIYFYFYLFTNNIQTNLPNHINKLLLKHTKHTDMIKLLFINMYTTWYIFIIYHVGMFT